MLELRSGSEYRDASHAYVSARVTLTSKFISHHYCIGYGACTYITFHLHALTCISTHINTQAHHKYLHANIHTYPVLGLLVECKLVGWLACWHLIDGEPVHCSLQHAWHLTFNVTNICCRTHTHTHTHTHKDKTNSVSCCKST